MQLDQKVEAGFLDGVRAGNTNVRMLFVPSDNHESERPQEGCPIYPRSAEECFTSQSRRKRTQLGIGYAENRDAGIERLRQRRADFKLSQANG